MAPYPSGKGEVCKTFMHRFESDRRLLIQSTQFTIRCYERSHGARWRAGRKIIVIRVCGLLQSPKISERGSYDYAALFRGYLLRSNLGRLDGN